MKTTAYQRSTRQRDPTTKAHLLTSHHAAKRGRNQKGSNLGKITASFLATALLILGYYRYTTQHLTSNGGSGAVVHRRGVGNANKQQMNPNKLYSHNFPEPPPTDDHGTRYHVIFSTSCSDLTHWQSYLLFYQALKIGQIGNVTRIASSCSDEEKVKEEAWHEEHISSQMSDRFRIHFTPMFSTVKSEDGSTKGKNYKFFNKPFGLRHWMEHGEGMGIDPSGTGQMVDEDVVVILLDPDMAMLRPITADFSDDSATIISGPMAVQPHPSKRVEHGYPYAQLYGFGSQWFTKIDLAKVAGEDSPALSVSLEDARHHYAVGPPYVATSRDMYEISTHWSDYVREVHKQYPELLAEMFAYSIAAAHLKLPHTVAKHLMVSTVGKGGGEGFPFIQKIPDGETCKTGYDTVGYDGPLPSVIHFCQRCELLARRVIS